MADVASRTLLANSADAADAADAACDALTAVPAHEMEMPV
jgi:hypothetical protein